MKLTTKLNASILKVMAAVTTLGVTGVAKAQFDASSIVAPAPVDNGTSLADLITKVVTVGLYIVGVVAVIYLIWGGISYVTAGGDAEKAGKGRTTIVNAIIGIIIIIASLAIYNTVTKMNAK